MRLAEDRCAPHEKGSFAGEGGWRVVAKDLFDAWEDWSARRHRVLIGDQSTKDNWVAEIAHSEIQTLKRPNYSWTAY